MAKRHGRDSDDNCCDGDRDHVPNTPEFCDGVIEKDPYWDWEVPPDVVMFIIFGPGEFFADIENDPEEYDNCGMEPNPVDGWTFEFTEPLSCRVEEKEISFPPDRDPEPFFLINEGHPPRKVVPSSRLEEFCLRYGFKADFDMDGIGEPCDNDPDNDDVPDNCRFDSDQSNADQTCPPANPDKDPND